MAGQVRRAAGFTLLEVLVALVIAVPALLVMYRQGALALDMTRSAAAYQEALSRARSRLDALQDAALVTSDRNGEDGGLYRWHTRISPVASTGPARQARPGSPYARGTTLYSVLVEIAWPGPRGTQTVRLATRRLGPAAGASP
ncbi:MAG TPA: type II secretion system protein [Acetobacteraceae bacterium]|nr:type II secretion system protein [Acetobacteraceae bacterium]